jgi:hypothetical protein
MMLATAGRDVETKRKEQLEKRRDGIVSYTSEG